MKFFTPRARAVNLGSKMEDVAAHYLRSAGLTIERRNYRCTAGEIDLIARDNETLVFVEVRYRRSARFGGAKVSVNRSKQQKLLTAASHYLQQQKLNCPCRFDVIAIEGGDRENGSGAKDIHWITNAFWAEGH